MSVREETITAEAFLEIANAPENADKRLELVRGVLVEMPPSSFDNSLTGYQLGSLLNVFVMQNGLGYVSGPDGGYRLADDHIRQPDAGFVRKTRITAPPPKIFDGAPGLAIEVVSPREDALDKAIDYLEAGTLAVWAIYGEKRSVRVMHLDTEGKLVVETLTEDDTLSGGDIIPGFTVRVRDIFPQYGA